MKFLNKPTLCIPTDSRNNSIYLPPVPSPTQKALPKSTTLGPAYLPEINKMPVIHEHVELLLKRDIVNDLNPNEDERNTLIIIGVYIIVILIFWNVPKINVILYPLKLLTVALHEFSHAAVGCCTGAKIEGIEVDPNEGGVTRMQGGIQCCTLPAGYLGSSLIGAILIFCGFQVNASKYASIVLGILLIIVLWWARNWLTRIITVVSVGVIVALWFIKDGAGLRYRDVMSLFGVGYIG
ncbi:6791_t:CDS:2 [Acaulospora morrowiae]|uniref:6791_t:CDS:1 n=1 Tax=Acaulospora morrowiae TaxID=94023 RepID=A0A9N8V1P3_9GLOM|nr:6791_t:CDS:2 [Acaulospora morrowiae]